MTAGLSARPRAYMLLDLFPFFAVHFERLQESEMLVTRPPTCGLGAPDHLVGLTRRNLVLLSFLGRLSARFRRKHLA